MVAIPFRKQFAPMILAGTKGGTIRGPWKTPHPQEGQLLQLYIEWRTPRATRLLTVECLGSVPIALDFDRERVIIGDPTVAILQRYQTPAALNRFAVFDGFTDWAAFCESFAAGRTGARDGALKNLSLIRWKELPRA
jgi:hypothetical protein